MTETNVGIVGCGNISAAYLELAPLFKGMRITACADINTEAAKAAAAKHGIKGLSVDELLADDSIGCVINLTIPAAHFEVSSLALEAGKHVYSEKPLALNMENGVMLEELALAQGLQVGCAPDTFLGGAHQTARQAIDAGAIGEITSGSCHVMSPGMESWHPNPDFFFKPGAGPVLDIGPYYVANLVNLIGPVKQVVAMANTPRARRVITSEPRAGEELAVETPTTLLAILEFVSGAKVTLSASWDVIAHRHANMELYGQKGSMYVPDPNFFAGEVVVTAVDGKQDTLKADDHPLGRPNVEHDGQPLANYRSAGLADMLAAIADGREPRCSLARALHALEVMTGIIESAEKESFVQMKTSCTRPAPLDAQAAAALLA